VKPEALHITLAFIGEQDESGLLRAAESLQDSLEKFSAFETRANGFGFFPHERRPRVCWVGLQPAEPFLDLAAATRQALRKADVSFDAKSFHPHLTIGRVRDGWSALEGDVIREGAARFRSQAFGVGSVVLFSSKLAPAGATHTVIERFDLEGGAAPSVDE
jgi:2'-5' RNA ligase